MQLGTSLALLFALISMTSWSAGQEKGAPPRKLGSCVACHGVEGRSQALPEWGRIAGQNYNYLVYVLWEYRRGGRKGVNAGLMSSFAAELSDADIKELAQYYSNLK